MVEFVNSNGIIELFALAWSAFWVIVALHWMPWPIWLGHDLNPPWTYIIGVGDMLLHYFAWMVWTMPSADFAILGIVSIVASVGFGVLQAYRLDELGARRRTEKFGGQDNHADRGR